MDGNVVYAVAVEVLVEVVVAEGFRRVQGVCPSFSTHWIMCRRVLSFPSVSKHSYGQRSSPSHASAQQRSGHSVLRLVLDAAQQHQQNQGTGVDISFPLDESKARAFPGCCSSPKPWRLRGQMQDQEGLGYTARFTRSLQTRIASFSGREGHVLS